MNIRGLNRFSLIDCPGMISCIVFIGGCNFRCPYCHNPHLVIDPQSQPKIRDDTFFDFLLSRKGKLDAVVVSGGEPCMQPDLVEFLTRIKGMNFYVKLDTNGSFTDAIVESHRKALIDCIGLDFKAPLEKYHIAAGIIPSQEPQKVLESLEYIAKNGISSDIRTTVHKKLHSPEDLMKMKIELTQIGITDWTLQQFNRVDIIDESLTCEPTYSDMELAELADKLGANARGLAKHYLKTVY